MTKQKHECYLLFWSEQILICIFSAFSQSSLLSSQQETLSFKLISWLLTVRFSNSYFTTEKSCSSYSQHIFKITWSIQHSALQISHLQSDAIAQQVWQTSHSRQLQSTSFLMKKCQMSNQTLHDRWSSESCKENRTAAANIIWHNYMKELQICNHNESNLHIFMIDTADDSLHDEFRTRKWF